MLGLYKYLGLHYRPDDLILQNFSCIHAALKNGLLFKLKVIMKQLRPVESDFCSVNTITGGA
jgi:hypothetical protein